MEKYVNHDYFSCIDTEDKAYFLGLLLADGTINKRREEYTIVSLHVSQQDIDIVEKFKHYTQSENKIYIGSKINDCALRITSRKMVNDLSKFGIIPQKTGKNTICVDDIPEDLIRHFIRGLIEGDGWYSISNTSTGRVVTSVGVCGDYNTCDFVQQWFQKILGTSPLKVSKVKNKNCYKIGYSSYDVGCRIVDYLYKDATVFINRKMEKAHELKHARSII